MVVVPKRARKQLEREQLHVLFLFSTIFFVNMASENLIADIETLSVLTAREIQTVLDTTSIQVPREERRPKAAFMQHIVKFAPSHVLLQLLEKAGAKKKRKSEVGEKSPRTRKRARQQVGISLEEIEEEEGVGLVIVRSPRAVSEIAEVLYRCKLSYCRTYSRYLSSVIADNYCLPRHA